MKNPKILIIGAGASGLAAATKLLENGFSDLMIFEAKITYGGRIHSVDIGGSMADLGAQWCHGGGNVVYDTVKDLDLIQPSFNSYDDYTFYQFNGTSLDKSITDRLFQLGYEVAGDNEMLTKADCSFGKYFTERFEEQVRKRYGDNEETLKLSPLISQWFEKLILCLCAGYSWGEISANGVTHYKECEGHGYYNWKKKGYRTFLDVLLRKCPSIEGRISYSKVVEKITWSENTVDVNCSDGTICKFDNVIVTIPLGVLKEKYLNLFEPKLPSAKITAINSLGFGTVNKILLKFPSRWWPIDCKGFNFLWTDEDRRKIQREFPQAVDKNGKIWLEGIFDFFVVDSHSEVLLGWVVGPSSTLIESLSDEAVIEGCVYLLKNFLGHKHQVETPCAIFRSYWYSNPYSRGSYSFRSVETDKQNTSADALSQPLMSSDGKPLVLFAGEATHPHYYSTVHGAVETGYREAERIINMYKMQCKVVIVGGGLAGLGAALTLHERGCEDFLLLEAQGALGGRVKTISFAEGHLDLGAQWMHGNANALHDLANNHQLIAAERSEEACGVYIRDDGLVFDDFLVKRVDFEIGRILEDCESFVNLPDYPASVGDYLEERFRQYLNNSSDSAEIQEMKLQLYHWHVKFQLIDNSCTNLRKLSAKDWGKYECAGETGQAHINLQSGYMSLINLLKKRLSNDCLKLETPVLNIAWSNPDGKVLIRCHNNLKVMCDHVIVTASLGVLKTTPELFTPPLPNPLADAIHHLGFAGMGKVFLMFEYRWWKVEGFQLIWRDSSAGLDEELEWVRWLTGFDSVVGQTNVLLGWVGGRGVEIMEQLPEETVGEHCAQVLRRFLKQDVPSPVKTIRTTWTSSPWIRGSYSHTTIECDHRDLGPQTLSQPVMVDGSPRVLLAGEACHPSHFSTTHGAFESGQQQAQFLLNYIE